MLYKKKPSYLCVFCNNINEIIYLVHTVYCTLCISIILKHNALQSDIIQYELIRSFCTEH